MRKLEQRKIEQCSNIRIAQNRTMLTLEQHKIEHYAK